MMWVWSPRGEDVKIKTTKISSKGLTSNSAKICTSENFPLYIYGISMRAGVAPRTRATQFATMATRWARRALNKMAYYR